MKTIKVVLGFLLFALLFTSCEKDEVTPTDNVLEMRRFGNGNDNNGSNFDKATAPVIDPTANNATVGIATLIRESDKVKMSYSATNLIPGHTYTVWWVVWNKPENCQGYPDGQPCDTPDFNIADQVEVEIMYATGAVVPANRRIIFSGELSENDASGSINADFGLPGFGGLKDAETAEIHLVLRSHGPVIPGQVDEQISSYGGGCTTNLPDFSEVPDEAGECADIQYAIFIKS